MRKLEDVGFASTAVKLYNRVVQRGDNSIITEKEFSEKDLEGFRNVIKEHIASSESPLNRATPLWSEHGITYADYGENSPSKNMIGMFTFYKNKDGDFIIKDRYNFNDSNDFFGPENNPLEEIWAAVRYGTPSAIAADVGQRVAPSGKGAPIEINLGKIKGLEDYTNGKWAKEEARLKRYRDAKEKEKLR